MSETKNSIISFENLNGLAQQAGFLLMTAAVSLVAFEGAHRPEQKVVLPVQPAMSPIGEHAGGQDPVSRERTEVAPHHVSYSEIQRTPSRSGKQ